MTRWDKLNYGAVDVWHLNTDPSLEESVMAILSDEERARVVRFRNPQHGMRFAASRAALRFLLGRYLDREPDGLKIGYTSFGKPILIGDTASIAFNVSHSGGVALIAIAKSAAVGVDIEEVNKKFSVTELAKEVFSKRELARFSALPGPAQQVFFFDTWAMKEAFLKAEGSGLSIPPTSLEAGLLPVARIFVARGFASAVACLPDPPKQILLSEFAWD
jgi:4'-phosphopantetheinyl transferase